MNLKNKIGDFTEFWMPTIKPKKRWWQFWKKKEDPQLPIIEEIISIEPMTAPNTQLFYVNYTFGNHTIRIKCPFEEEFVEDIRKVMRSICHNHFMLNFRVSYDAIYADMYAGESLVIQTQIDKKTIKWQTGDGWRWDSDEKSRLLGDPNWVSELKKDVKRKYKDSLFDMQMEKAIDQYVEVGW